MRVLEGAKTWVALSRLPFHSVGILPFILGTVLAYRYTGAFNTGVFFLALSAVILIMLSTHYNGEAYDVKEDKISGEKLKSAFAGGSQMVVQAKVSQKKVKLAACVCVFAAMIIGLLLQFCYKTGIWTIPLGASGIVFGYFYSKPPFRWVEKGIGELFIGYSYGWLPVAAGYYLQTATIIPVVHWISLPIACSIINVILINEFPDYAADKIALKNNLTVRIGKKKVSLLYVFLSVSGAVLFFVSLSKGVPKACGIFYIPVFILSLFACFSILAKRYEKFSSLENLCLFTILVNLGTALSYILGVKYF